MVQTELVIGEHQDALVNRVKELCEKQNAEDPTERALKEGFKVLPSEAARVDKILMRLEARNIARLRGEIYRAGARVLSLLDDETLVRVVGDVPRLRRGRKPKLR